MPNKEVSPGRRGTYFAFQGLLTAVLLAIFLIEHRNAVDWPGRFAAIAVVLGSSLALIRLLPPKALSSWTFTVGLFLGDAAMATLTLYWTRPNPDLSLIYLLIVFGAALTRDLRKSLAVAAVTSILFLASAWRPQQGLPTGTAFWLRFNFIWIISALLAILSRDSQQAQSESERLYNERLLQAERAAALGGVAGEVAHRIKGPLTTIMVNAEVLAHRHPRAKDLHRELEQIQGEARHCKEILKALLDLGRIEEMDIGPCDLREPIRSALESIRPVAKKAGVRLEAEGLERAARVIADAGLLHEAIAAILLNGVEASPPGGRVEIALTPPRRGSWWAAAGRPRFHVEIRDEGRGFTPEERASFFKPFFTTKGEGSGLGLAAALRILQKHGGAIEAESDGPGTGACFSLLIPRG